MVRRNLTRWPAVSPCRFCHSRIRRAAAERKSPGGARSRRRRTAWPHLQYTCADGCTRRRCDDASRPALQCQHTAYQCITLHPCSQLASWALYGWRSNLFATRCSARSRRAPGRPSDVEPRWYPAPASDPTVVGKQSQDRAQADHLRVNTRIYGSQRSPALGRWSLGCAPRR